LTRDDASVTGCTARRHTSSFVPAIVIPFNVPVTVTNAPTLMFFAVPIVKWVMASQCTTYVFDPDPKLNELVVPILALIFEIVPCHECCMVVCACSAAPAGHLRA